MNKRVIAALALLALAAGCAGGKQGQSSSTTTTTTTTTTTSASPGASPAASPAGSPAASPSAPASPAASPSASPAASPAVSPTAAPTMAQTVAPKRKATTRPVAAVPPKKAAAATVSFTAAQASAGETQWAQSCAACHGENMEGGAGPALAGPKSATLTTKLHATVSDIFGYMTTNMPLNNPASLTHEQYANIMAYILQKNGYKASSAPLTFEEGNASKAPLKAPGAP